VEEQAAEQHARLGQIGQAGVHPADIGSELIVVKRAIHSVANYYSIYSLPNEYPSRK
jgi:hypothetical protein